MGWMRMWIMRFGTVYSKLFEILVLAFAWRYALHLLSCDYCVLASFVRQVCYSLKLDGDLFKYSTSI
jgi:hypothetical protein